MGLSIPLNEVNPDALTGGDRPAYGKYHVQIVHADHYGGSNNEMTIDYMVLAGDVPDQEGKTLRDYYYKSEKAMGRILTLAVALGMTTIDDLKRMKEAGTDPDLDFETDGVGRQCCVLVEKDEHKGKEKPRVNFGIWHVDDPKAAEIPKHAAQLAEFRRQYGVAAPAGGGPAGNGAAAPPATAPAAAPKPAGDYFADANY